MIFTGSAAIRSSITQNKWIWIFGSLLLAYWIYGWFNCIDIKDWILENVLVVIGLSILFATHKWHRLSDLSYCCIFIFIFLHVYGAFYAYTQNTLGTWLQQTFHLWRNPYDRIVHFSFGLLMAYPFREILTNRFKVPARTSWWLPIEIAFSFGTVFEMIEWAVAVLATRETGETYVATQGDVWDAHKDIALAAAGAAIAMLITWAIQRRKNNN